MELHNHLIRFRDSLSERYGRVDISYQVDRRHDPSVLLRINSPDIKESDIVDELLALFQVLGEEGFSLVILDDETLLTFDPQLSVIEMSLADGRFQNNTNIVNAVQVDTIPTYTCSSYTYSLAA